MAEILKNVVYNKKEGYQPSLNYLREWCRRGMAHKNMIIRGYTQIAVFIQRIVVKYAVIIAMRGIGRFIASNLIWDAQELMCNKIEK